MSSMTDRDNITLPREVVQEALEALEYAERHHGGDDCYAESITALRTHLAAPPEDIEALRRDAERWRCYQSAGSELTLRLHNTRSDHRNAAIDAAMGEKR